MSAPRTPFYPADAAFADRVRASFARQKAMAHLGASLEEVEAGRCVVQLPHHDEVTQQHGYIHGGVVGAIADSAAGYAAMTLTPADTSVLTVSYTLNLMAPAAGDHIEAHGEVVRAGRTLLVTRADVFAYNDGEATLCATLQQTIMALPDRPERQAQAR